MNRLRLAALAPLLAAALALPASAGNGDCAIAPGDVAFGDLLPGDMDRVVIDGVEGLRLSFDLRAAFPLAVVVRDPHGQVANPGPALRVREERARLRNWVLPESGKWSVEISVAPGAGPSGARAKGGDDDPPGDDHGDDALNGSSWRMESSVRATRRVRASASGTPGEEMEVDLGVFPGGATLTVTVSGGTLTGLAGPVEGVALEPGRRGSADLPDTGSWSAVVVPSGTRAVKVKATTILPAWDATEREALEDDGVPDDDGDLLGGTVIVKLREGAAEDAFEARHGDGIPEGEEFGLEWYEVTVPAGISAEDFLDELGLDEDVIEEEPVLLSESPEGEQSNVAFTASDATLTDVQTQEAFVLTGALQAQGVATGQGVIVAVVDTGIVAGSHPALAGRLLPGKDFADGDDDPTDAADGVDNDGDGTIDEGVGHGTFIAGIVATVAPGASILPVRVLDSDARGSSLRVARGIVWAAAHGAKVINLSLGVRRASGVIQDAVQYARKQGALVVCAAGNAGRTTGVTFPAGLSDVLTVTAVNGAGVRAPFSNVSSRVSLAAPGVDVLGPHVAAGFAQWSGTSFAAPFASAGAAMVLSRTPGMNAGDAGKVLMDTAVPVDAVNPGLEGALGQGRLDLPAAVGQ